MDFDTTVKLNIYETIARTTQAPSAAQVAQSLATPLEGVLAAFDRLHQKRLLVPNRAIRVAFGWRSFSGVETPFRVLARGKSICQLRLGFIRSPGGAARRCLNQAPDGLAASRSW
jgi:hypothetical protein